MQLVKRRIATYDKIAGQIDEIETILFERARSEHMPTDKLLALWGILQHRRDVAAKQAIEGTKNHINIEEVKVLVASAADPMVASKVDLAPGPAQKVVDAISKLADMVATKRLGMVTEPPK